MNIEIEFDPISPHFPHFHRVTGVIGGRRTQQLQSAAARNVAYSNLHAVDNPPLPKPSANACTRAAAASAMHSQMKWCLTPFSGSRALGQAREESDWDFAVQWRRDIPLVDGLGYTEILRTELARLVQTTQDQIDIVDIPAARLAMCAVIAEEGLLLKGENTLPWSHFLLKTWRDIEDFYWAKDHAA